MVEGVVAKMDPALEPDWTVIANHRAFPSPYCNFLLFLGRVNPNERRHERGRPHYVHCGIFVYVCFVFGDSDRLHTSMVLGSPPPVAPTRDISLHTSL